MKVIRFTSTAILSSLLGIAAPAYAQREQQGEKQERREERQSKPNPGQQHAQGQRGKQDHPQRQQAQHAQQQRQNQSRQTPQRAQQQQRPDQNRQTHVVQQERGNDRTRRTQDQQRVEQSAWQRHRSQRWDSDHRSWQQRGGYNGYRIPDDRYRGYFGRDHGFRVYGLPFMVVGGYPSFQYSGYWFSMVDPWPEYWGNNWYDNDDVYVMYVDNGYYLFNRRYPNAGVTIRISM